MADLDQEFRGYGLVDPDAVKAAFKDDCACAAEILAESLIRISVEKAVQANIIADLREQLGIAIALHSEAEVAERAIRRLMDGELYVDNGLMAASSVAAEESPPSPEEPPPVLAPATTAGAPTPTAGEPQRPLMAPVPERTASPPLAPASKKPFISGTGTRVAQEEAVMAFLASVADETGEVRGFSFSAIGEGASVPGGSVPFIVHGLADVRRLIVRKGEPGKNKVPPKNIYRLVRSDGSGEPEPKAAPAPVIAPIPKPEPLKAFGSAPVDDGQDETTTHEGPALLIRLRSGQCHWPLEDSPTGADQLYCAAPCASDQQYCPKHRLAMYAPARPRKTEAERNVH